MAESPILSAVLTIYNRLSDGVNLSFLHKHAHHIQPRRVRPLPRGRQLDPKPNLGRAGEAPAGGRDDLHRLPDQPRNRTSGTPCTPSPVSAKSPPAWGCAWLGVPRAPMLVTN